MKKIQKCLRCGAGWKSKVENPVQCPRCKRVDWNNSEDEKLVRLAGVKMKSENVNRLTIKLIEKPEEKVNHL